MASLDLRAPSLKMGSWAQTPPLYTPPTCSYAQGVLHFNFKLCCVGLFDPLFNFKLCSMCLVGSLQLASQHYFLYIALERGVFEHSVVTWPLCIHFCSMHAKLVLILGYRVYIDITLGYRGNMSISVSRLLRRSRTLLQWAGGKKNRVFIPLCDFVCIHAIYTYSMHGFL